MAKRVYIVVAEPSEIIRCGLSAVLERVSNLSINIAEVSDVSNITNELKRLRPDILIINPSHFGAAISHLREIAPSLRIIALQSALSDQSLISSYDGCISIYDNIGAIQTTLSKVVESSEVEEIRSELSHREREIVICIAKGMSNKEIADKLSLSTHTVISHRRNITTKLDIYSPSGLTVYAIVNKLIDIDNIDL